MISSTRNLLSRVCRLSIRLHRNFAVERQATGSERFGYDNILSKLSSADTINEVMNIYKTNGANYKTEHYAMCCRTLARAIKRENYRGNDLDEVVEKIAAEYKNFNAYQLLDLTFFLRILKNSELQLKTQIDESEVVKTLEQHLNNKQYTFRNLVNLYYDLALLKKVPNSLLEELSNKFKEEAEKNSLRSMSVFNLSMIIKSACERAVITGREQNILKMTFDAIDSNGLASEFTSVQKAELFRAIAKLRLDSVSPIFAYPAAFIKTMHDQLLADIENLSEKSILDILDGASYLPRGSYYRRLGDEVRKTIFDNIEPGNKDSSITFSFFIKCMKRIIANKNRRLRMEEVTKFIEFARVELPVYESLFVTMNTITCVTEGNFKYDNQLEIASLLAQKDKLTLPLVEFIASKNPKLLEGKLLSAFESYNNNKSMLFRWSALLDELPETDETKAIRAKIGETELSVTSRINFILKNSFVSNNLKIKQIAKIFLQTKDNYTTEFKDAIRREKSLFIAAIMVALLDRSSRKAAQEFLGQHPDVFNSENSGKILEGFGLIQNFQQSQLIFSNILQLAEQGCFVPYQLINFFKTPSVIELVANANPSVQKRFFDVVFKNLVTHNTKQGNNDENFNIYTPSIYTILKQFEYIEFDQDSYRNFLKNIATRIESGFEFVKYFSVLLFEKGLLNKENAEALLRNFKPESKSYIKTLLESFIDNSTLPQFEFEPYNAMKLRLLLQYNPKLYEDKIENILAFVEKKDIKKNDWLNIVISLREFSNKTYYRITSALFDQYENFLKKLTWEEHMKVARVAAELSYKKNNFWSKFYEVYFSQFNSLSQWERIHSLELAYKARIIREDTLKEVLQRFIIDPSTFEYNENRLIDLYFKYGYSITPEELAGLQKIFGAQDYFVGSYVKLLTLNANVSGIEEAVAKQVAKLAESKAKLNFPVYVCLRLLEKTFPSLASSLTGLPEKIDRVPNWLIEKSRYQAQVEEYFNKVAEITGNKVEFSKQLTPEFTADVVLGTHAFKFMERNDAYFGINVPVGEYQAVAQLAEKSSGLSVHYLPKSGKFLFSNDKYNTLQKLVSGLDTHAQALGAIESVAGSKNEGKVEEETTD